MPDSDSQISNTTRCAARGKPAIGIHSLPDHARFLAGTDIRLQTAAKIAAYVGLTLKKSQGKHCWQLENLVASREVADTRKACFLSRDGRHRT
jgi:proteasome lid subunit RPN8/RPN11